MYILANIFCEAALSNLIKREKRNFHCARFSGFHPSGTLQKVRRAEQSTLADLITASFSTKLVASVIVAMAVRTPSTLEPLCCAMNCQHAHCVTERCDVFRNLPSQQITAKTKTISRQNSIWRSLYRRLEKT